MCLLPLLAGFFAIRQTIVKRIVRFQTGEYGIRRGWFFGYAFIDLNNPFFSWRPNSSSFYSCFTMDLDKVKRVYNRFYSKPVQFIEVKKDNRKEILKVWEELNNVN
jgi:hypothetical protein